MMNSTANQAPPTDPPKTRFGHLNACLDLLAEQTYQEKPIDEQAKQDRKQSRQAKGQSTAQHSEPKQGASPDPSAPRAPQQQPPKSPAPPVTPNIKPTANAHTRADTQSVTQAKANRAQGLSDAKTAQQSEQLGVFKRRPRRPVPPAHPNAHFNGEQEVQAPVAQQQEQPSNTQQEDAQQDLFTMNKSTLDLSRAAALAKQIKANGGKLPEQTSPESAALTGTSGQSFTEAPSAQKRKLPASALVDTDAVKAEVSAHVNAVQQAARKSLAENIQKSGLISDGSAQEASAKIEQMVQNIVDLYVPLFERELRITLENDILDKLSQSEEV